MPNGLAFHDVKIAGTILLGKGGCFAKAAYPSSSTKGQFMTQPNDKYPDTEGSRRAMIRAARRAADLAKQHNQPLLLWRDGEVVSRAKTKTG